MNSIRRFFLLATLLLFTAPLLAQPYIGFGVGSVKYTVDFSALGGSDYSDRSTGTKLYGGWAFNRYLALEAAYYKFAEASIGKLEVQNRPPVSAAAKSDGVGAMLVLSYPFSKKTAVAAKAGLLRWQADLRVDQSTAGNDGTDMMFGLQANYFFTREVGVVAEWERFNSDNPELDLLSIGFRYRFK